MLHNKPDNGSCVDGEMIQEGDSFATSAGG